MRSAIEKLPRPAGPESQAEPGRLDAAAWARRESRSRRPPKFGNFFVSPQRRCRPQLGRVRGIRHVLISRPRELRLLCDARCRSPAGWQSTFPERRQYLAREENTIENVGPA